MAPMKEMVKREREVNSEMKKSEADSIDEEMLETSLKKKKEDKSKRSVGRRISEIVS